MLRIQGVLQVKESKYIMPHAPRSALKAITGAAARHASRRRSFRSKAATTRSPLHAVCRENVFWETLEQLKKPAQSSMLVSNT